MKWEGQDMRRRLRTYTAYSIGCAVAWAVIFAIRAPLLKHTDRTVLMVFGGWVLGWAGATIARYMYPPPARWRERRPESEPPST